jgi:methylmalonyl-CoA/ethylmalonyl-CoA epimerase
MFNFKDFDHVAIAVKDLDEAKERFEALFGGEPIREMVMEKLAVKAAYYLLGKTLVGLETPIGDGDIQRFLEKHGEGIHHLGLAVTNLNETEQELRNKGFRLIGPEVKDGVRTDLFVHPKSFFNILLQVIEWEEPYRSSLDERITFTLNEDHVE